MSADKILSAADLPLLPPRAKDSHKGDYGRILLIGGSRGMAGAIALAGMAALRSGAGLVRMAVPDRVLDVVAAFEPSLMTRGLPNDVEGRLTLRAVPELANDLEWADVVAIGPGIGRSEELTKLVGELWSQVDKPAVVDADALFALAEIGKHLPTAPAPRVITPHAGEFARLLGEHGKSMSSEANKPAASDWASEYRAIVVLKGPHTFVTDGNQHYENNTGNPGMATGGMGDILTGIIAALIGQKLNPFAAACLGVHIHGLAGDLGAEELGQVSLIASDMLKYLPAAFKTYHSPSENRKPKTEN